MLFLISLHQFFMNYQIFLIFLLQISFSTMFATENCPELTVREVLPDHENYNKSRLISNYYTSKDLKPDVIVYCKNAKDVQNAVKWALCKKMPVRIRSGGHHHEGFSTGKGLVIDVSEMKKIEIDPKTNIA